jgi:putative membrane protein
MNASVTAHARAAVGVGAVRFRRAPHGAEPGTASRHGTPQKNSPTRRFEARVLRMPIPAGCGTPRSKLCIPRSLDEKDEARDVRLSASAAPALSNSWDADDEVVAVNVSSDEYVKKARSGVAGLQPKSAVCEDMYCTDPGLNQLLISEGSSISRLFSQDEWERHRSVGRYWRHLFSTWKSTIFLRVLEPVLLITAVAAALALWNLKFAVMLNAPVLQIAPLAHQLSGGIVSLSLVFRTNNSNRRVIDARSLLAKMSKCTRDLTRMSQYVPNQNGLRLDILKHLRSFPYALESHVRKGRTRSDSRDPTAFRVDPVPGMARALGAKKAQRLAYYENIPAQVLFDMSQLMNAALALGMSTQMHQQCEIIIKELSSVISESEKILYTPIPISYTRHTSRTLTLWLLTLPFSLWGVLGLATIPAIFMLGWLMLGVDEIGIEIEEPFCILPVRPLCDMAEREIVGGMAQALRADDWLPAAAKK